jgi:hypothetical protein
MGQHHCRIMPEFISAYKDADSKTCGLLREADDPRQKSNNARRPLKQDCVEGHGSVLRTPQSNAALAASGWFRKLLEIKVMNWSRSFAVVTLLMATPAAAQMYPSQPHYGGVISPGQVMGAVQSLGLRPVSEPHLRGPVWVVRAVGRDGTLVRVVVDSQSGRVVNMTAIDRPMPPNMVPGEPDPRFVMRGQRYPGPSEDYSPPPQPQYRGGQQPYGSNQPPYGGGQAMPDDDDDQPMPPDGRYAPRPNSSINQPQSPRQASAPKSFDPLLGVPPEFRGKNVKIESKPADKRVASKPVTTPLPKARPDEAKKDPGPAVASGPKEPETTGSIPEKKTGDETKKTPDVAPVQPLE